MRQLNLFVCILIIGGLKVLAQPDWSKGQIEWIDSVKEAPKYTSYQLFASPSRGENTMASYLIYLPPTYQSETNKRYPVIYWLHGGGGNQREGAWMVEQIDKAIKEKTLPEVIVVLVQGLPSVRYVNTKDGTRPVEDVIIKDLIPHIDATYRTINSREFRAIEGMSMGGYGALHLGLKYHELFGVISALAPSILPMKEEDIHIQENFGYDEEYYALNDPWTLVRENSNFLRDRTKLRILIGDTYEKLSDVVYRYHLLIDSLEIKHKYNVVPGAEHNYVDIISKAPFNTFSFWAEAFKDTR
jgi:enterochelin esterase-like enzyme